MQTVSFAGSSYNIPNTRGDRPWSGLSDFVIAAASKAINTGGGNFTLLADINFGATYGLVSTYYKSRTANVASAGQIRLANADTIKFRNTLNDGDLSVAIATNRLTFQGSRLIIAGAAEIVNADISASAAIAYSKLALTGSIVNADIGASAAIAYSKLALTGSIVNADLTAGTITNTAINASAAIAYSKLALTGSIVNGDITAGTLTNAAINASAAIAMSKLAALTASRALVTDGSGFHAVATTTATEIGYVNGVTSALQTQLNAKASLALDNLASTAVNTDIAMGSHKLTGLSAGSAAGNSARFEQLKVIQYITATTTTTFTTTSSTYQTTNLTASITPTSTSNKILIIATGVLGVNASNHVAFGALFNGASNLMAASGEGEAFAGSSTSYHTATLTWVDSPASVSAQTYSVKIKNDDNATTVRLGDGGTQFIILMELA